MNFSEGISEAIIEDFCKGPMKLFGGYNRGFLKAMIIDFSKDIIGYL